MSATPEPPIAVSTLRDAVRGAVAASTTRAVAEAIGISQAGIRKFLDGSTPHPGTVRKLVRWYLHSSAAPLERETAEAAIDLLVRSYPESERYLVRASLLEVLREAYRKLGTKPPPWLVEG